MGILTSLTNTNRLTAGLQKIHSKGSLSMISAAAALLYTCYQITPSFWKKEPSKYKEIPMPSEGNYPIVGHFLSLGDEQQFEEKLSVWHKELGPIIKLKFGVQTWIFVNDPRLAQEIFVNNGTKSSGRREAVFRYYYHGKHGKWVFF